MIFLVIKGKKILRPPAVRLPGIPIWLKVVEFTTVELRLLWTQASAMQLMNLSVTRTWNELLKLAESLKPYFGTEVVLEGAILQ